MKTRMLDSGEIAGTRIRDDGYLVVDARIARTGIQQYLGVELGRPEKTIVNVYRPESEVFSVETMKSFAHRPVTNDHPDCAVTAENWKLFARGQSGDSVARDGQFLRVPLMVADGELIQQIKDGKRELSAGYTCDLKWEGGKTPDGQTYDAIQTNIRANHVAVVERGRAGKDCRIGDRGAAIWGASPTTVTDREQNNKHQEKVMKVIVDGLSVETTDAGGQAIEKLLKDREALQKSLADAKAAKDKVEEEKKAELAKKEAELDKLKDSIPSAEALSKMVADRVELESKALKLAKDVKPKGLTDNELKAAVVKNVLGDRISAEKLKDAHYIDARFDIMVEDANKPVDAFKAAVQGGLQTDGQIMDAREAAWEGMLKYNQTGQEPAKSTR